jgi:Protein of unknown function (DUF445)/Dienelactone hydrolase family
MRLAALSAVALMLVLFVASSLLRDRFSTAQWLRAFSEAGIAGALADWYAVVALFRHPLALPFPHTAIIPNNKDRIEDSVGAFLETHFLTSQNVVDRLARLDLAATMSEWLRQPSNSRDLADLLCDLIPPTLRTVDDAEVRTLVERLAVSQMELVDLVAVADRLITTVGGETMKDPITIEGRDGAFGAYIARPKVLPAPAVVVLHEVFGVNADIRKTCGELAEQGCIAVAPDLFWHQEPGVDLSANLGARLAPRPSSL